MTKKTKRKDSDGWSTGRPKLDVKLKIRLWTLAGGRCQYAGCNRPLWRDDLTMAEMNRAYIAHIRDVNSLTHRYHPDLSPKLERDISNLMLMCDTHHRLIDREQEKEHTVRRLQKMKRDHEERIEIQTDIKEDRQSHLVMYGANIGDQSPVLSYSKCSPAMMPDRYPAEPRGIELSMNGAKRDREDDYWETERENLDRKFASMVRDRLRPDDIQPLSVFAMAPIPLLMELGRLLTDIPAADVYQLHREPQDWKWQSHPDCFQYTIFPPDGDHHQIALNISLSDSISRDRIQGVLGEDVSIWTLTVPHPGNDFLQSKEQLRLFRETCRELFRQIKCRHGHGTTVHVFPAMPVSTAVEFGRVWMPKPDANLIIYDENQDRGGFIRAFSFRAVSVAPEEADEEAHPLNGTCCHPSPDPAKGAYE